MSEHAWTAEEFASQLHSLAPAYHIHHPFNVMLNTGKASEKQLRAWVTNRFYYQASIPRKDAAILANCDDQAVRRVWIHRILDHDGHDRDPGGIEAWLRLAEAVGLSRAEVTSFRHVLPGVRFAVDAYVNFARQAPWQEAVCSSLTELFAPAIHKERLAGWPEFYPWIRADGLDYFRSRVSLAQRDVEHGLRITLASFTTKSSQRRALEVLQFKLDVLWSMNDAMSQAYMDSP